MAGAFSVFFAINLVRGHFISAAIDLAFVIWNVTDYRRDRQAELDERGDEC